MKSFWQKAALILPLCFISGPAWANMTYMSMSGVSHKDESVLTKPIGYGGMAGACDTTDGISTCNSCTGTAIAGTGLWPCNRTNVYLSLRFSIQVSHTLTGLINPNSEARVRIGEEDVGGFTFSYGTSGGNTLIAQATWQSLCQYFVAGWTPAIGTPECNFDKTMTLELTSNTAGSGSTQSLTFRLIAREVKVDSAATSPGTGWSYQDCATTAPANNYGFCHFEAYPGDEKIYANNLVVAENYPATPAAGIEFSRLVFFYNSYDGASDISTINSITNASPSYELTVNTGSSPPVSDNRMEGLKNGERYCFVMANQDITGIISYFTPSLASTGINAADLCSAPSQVVGLLDDKNCFIATAAFGSVMSPQVQTFRDFRDRYLLPNSWGKRFVQLYYQNSPEAVHYLAQSETLRTMARWMLWPLLWFAQFALQYGLGSALAVSLGGAFGFIGLFKAGKRYL